MYTRHFQLVFFCVFVAANTGLPDITCQTISTKNGEDSAECADKQVIKVVEARRGDTVDTSCNLTTFYSYPHWDNVTTRVSELCNNENSCYPHEILASCYLCKVFVILRCMPAPSKDITTVETTQTSTVNLTSDVETTSELTTIQRQSESTVLSSNNIPTTTTTLWVTTTLHLTASSKRYESTFSTQTKVATTILLSTASTKTSSELPVATIAGAAGGGVGVLLIVVVTVTLCRKSKGKRKSAKRDETYDSAWDNRINPTLSSRMFFGDYTPKQMLDQFENGTNTLHETHKALDNNDSTIYGSDTYDHTDRMFKRSHNNVEYVTKNPLHLNEENPTSYDFKF